jgi:alkylation response protein AidB-like acyl-CoA dehydrogenase
MHFLPTDEQRELQHGVRDLLADRFPVDRLSQGFDASVWRALDETGVFGLRAELGLGMAEAVLVFEELGRACVPGPLVATFLAADRADGPVALLDADQSPLLVAHLDVATAVLVLDTDVRLAPVPDATPIPEPIDPLSPLHEIAALPTGDVLADLDPVRARVDGAVLTAALQVGLAARLTQLSVGYAGEREQFGRSIGGFQAVKHICADMFVRTELARVAVHAAAVTLDADGPTEAARLVSGAKLLADEAAVTNGRAAVQVHGGMGFTWEVPVHYFLKRAWLHATEFGSADDHAEALAELL